MTQDCYFEYFECSGRRERSSIVFTIKCVCGKQFEHKLRSDDSELLHCPHCKELWHIGYHPKRDDFVGVTRPRTNAQIWLPVQELGFATQQKSTA